MRTPLIMSGEVLEELVFALRTTFSRVQKEDLASPSAKQNLLKIERWIRDVEGGRSQQASNFGVSQVPAFPISSAELHALQEAVDSAVQRREEQQQPLSAEQAERIHELILARPTQSWRENIHEALSHVHVWSVVLAVVLGLSLLLNVVELVALQFVPLTVLASINIAVLSVAFVLWVVLQKHLVQHIHLVHWHLPLMGK
jgi:hypothetical protein